MNTLILDNSNDRTNSIWNGLADQLLAAQQASQQPLNNALVERVFPELPSNVQAGIFTIAYERLRAAHRQIMQAIGDLPALAAA